MKKVVICLTALFFGCVGALFLMRWHTAKQDTKETSVNEKEVVELKAETTNKVVMLIDDGEKTKEIAQTIADKINLVMIEAEKWNENENETTKEIQNKKELEKVLGQAELILIGAEEENTDFPTQIDKLLEKTWMNQKRVSLFFVGQKEEILTQWEEDASQTGVNLLPGLWITWEKESREEELSYINGWLTTAFTYEKTKY